MSVGARGVGVGGVPRGSSDVSKGAKLETFNTSQFRIDSNTRRFLVLGLLRRHTARTQITAGMYTVMRSTKVVRRILTESNGTPAIDTWN